MTPDETLDPLLQAHLDGALDEAGEAELLRALSADPAASARLEEYVWLHHHFREAFSDRPAEAHGLADRVVRRIQRRQAERVRDKAVGTITARARRDRLLVRALFVLAAAALLAALGPLLLSSRKDGARPAGSSASPPEDVDRTREELALAEAERKRIEKRLAGTERGRRELSEPPPRAPEGPDPSLEEERQGELARLDESRRAIEAEMREAAERERRAREEAARPSPPRPTVAEIASLERAEGRVYLVSGAEEARARAGLRLVAGQGLRTEGPGSAAVVKYPDGTRLELGSDAALREVAVRAGGAKAVLLERGSLAALVARQPAGRPMVLATPHAEATILGTRVILSVAGDSTRLEVKEGRVRLRRPGDGAAVDVTSARCCVASAKGELRPRPLYLSARVSPAPENVDLTSEGTADWAHWGLETVRSFTRKHNVPPQIGGFLKVGTGSLHRYTNSPTSYSWADGSPFPKAAESSTGIYITGLGDGFQLAVPADPVPRTLRLYVGVWRSQGRFEAILNEPGVPPFVDESFGHPSSEGNAVCAIDYQAPSPGRTLVVRFTMARNLAVSGPMGNVTLQAATLSVHRGGR